MHETLVAFYEYCKDATFFTDESPEVYPDDHVEEPPKTEDVPPKAKKESPKPEEPKATPPKAEEPPTHSPAPDASAARRTSAPAARGSSKPEFLEIYIANMKRYADFNGRMERKDFWLFFACHAVAILVLTAISAGVLGFIYAIAAFLPAVGAVVRRLHDQNKTGLLWLIGLVPFVGIFIVLGLCCMEGTPGDNQYGEGPKFK